MVAVNHIHRGHGQGGTAAVDTSYLLQSNPRIDELLKRRPGVAAYLNGQNVSAGPKAGEVVLTLNWNIWTYSSSYPGSNMTDQQVLSNVLIAEQQDASGKRAIVAVHCLEDLPTPYKTLPTDPGQGGFIFRDTPIKVYGKPGDKVTIEWFVADIGAAGNIVSRSSRGGYAGRVHTATIPQQNGRSAWVAAT